jgi:L-fuconolactonase
MKIDTHQHYWRYAAEDFPWISDGMPALQKDCQPDDVLPDLQAAGVDAVVAVQARSCAAETGYLLDLATRNPQIVGVVGWTDLCAPDVAETLDGYAGQPLLKGFRHILQDETHLASLMRNPFFSRGVTAVQKHGLVYDVLVFDRQMSSVVDFCARHDDHWLVLDHVGKPGIRDWTKRPEVPSRWLAGMRSLAAMPHIACKLSGLVTEADWAGANGLMPQDTEIALQCFDRALELFGPNRIFYGSDWPVCQLAASYEAVHSLAQLWAETRLNAQEQNAFWSGNAVRCYNLKFATAQP